MCIEPRTWATRETSDAGRSQLCPPAVTSIWILLILGHSNWFRERGIQKPSPIFHIGWNKLLQAAKTTACHLLQGREQPPGRLCALAAKPLSGVNGHSTAGSAQVCLFSYRRHSEIPRRTALWCFLRHLFEERFLKRISQRKMLHVSPRHPFWHQHFVTSGLVILAMLTVVTPENTGAQRAPQEKEGKGTTEHHMATHSYKAPLLPLSAHWILPSALDCSLEMCDTCLLLNFQGNMGGIHILWIWYTLDAW